MSAISVTLIAGHELFTALKITPSQYCILFSMLRILKVRAPKIKLYQIKILSNPDGRLNMPQDLTNRSAVIHYN